MSKRVHANRAVFALLAAVLWGFNYPNARLILSRLTPAEMLLLRYPAAALVLLVILSIKREKSALRPADLPRLLFLGVIGVGVYNVIWTNGIRLTSAANAALFISCAPIFTTLYVAFSGREHVSAGRWVGVLLAFGGMLLVTFSTPGARLRLDSDAFLGNLICLGASVIFSAYNVAAEPLLKRCPPLKLTAIVTALGLVVLIPYGVCDLDADHLSGALRAGAPALTLELLYLVFGATAAAYVFWYRGVQTAGPARTVLYHYLVSVISMIVGALFLAEIPAPGGVLGAALVLAGLLTAATRQSSHESPAGLMENQN